MIKTVTVVMLVFASLFLFACSSEISDEEVRVILLNLVPRSQQLNDIFWGNGIKLEDEEAVTDGHCHDGAVLQDNPKQSF